MRPLLVLLVVLAACSAPVESLTTSVPADVSTTTSIRQTPAAATYRSVPCTSTPPVAFVVLCETYEDLMDFYVDEPEPAELAAAAALGVGIVEAGGGRTIEAFDCVIPHESFEVVCQSIARQATRGPVDLDVLVRSAVLGMFRYGLDPFSSYVPGTVMREGFDPTGLVIELGMVVNAVDPSGEACGPIGGDCRLTVLAIFEFGPADESGLAEGDVLTAIDGKTLEGLSPAEATVLLTGRPGTAVSVSVEQGGSVADRTMTRSDVRLVPSEADFLGDGVAYFRMNDFSQQAAIDLGAFLQLPEVQAASGLVLDLRDNPGGLVLAAQAVASQFLGSGLVMVERGRDFTEEVPIVEGGLATDRLDLVVLVNRASASASEIVAAVLQERGRAVIVGEETFGKNLVQFYDRARDGGQVGITVARWETPGGLSVGLTGLRPDVDVVDDPETEVDEAVELAISILTG